MPHKTVAVILSGCGVFDGAEIHEAVCSLLALDRAGLAYSCLAPDIAQMHVIDHRDGSVMDESRNVLCEASRIARGAITAIDQADVADYSAVLLPGGFGAAKNLSTFAVEGAACTVEAGTETFLTKAHAAGLPIAALCIAPAVLARVFGAGVDLTIGTDAGTAAAIESCGANHQDCALGDIVIDEARKIISSPCYMYDNARLSQIADSAEKVVAALQAFMA